MIDLKPCPFCGITAEMSKNYSPPFVFCPECHIKKMGITESVAAANWNQREAQGEPVYQVSYQHGSGAEWLDVAEGQYNNAIGYGVFQRRVLFTAPPPPSVPDELIAEELDWDCPHDQKLYSEGWNDCRDAWLNAAKQGDNHE